MEVERWERVKELFEAALERDEPERSPFLDQACSNDPDLRREVESLLSGDRKAGDFLQEPVGHISPAALANDALPSTFTPGEIVSGRFEILRFIGRGGMGEVYEARDLERHVRVALKTIRPGIASNPKTLARFNKEIDLALRVTHHNVCRVYDLERHRPSEDSGKPEGVFLTMELLEGETLADRLRRQGRMSCDEALPLIRQMADGLAAAHKEGVVHCDFKPGNVMLVSERPADADSLQSTQSVSVDGTRPAQASSGDHVAPRESSAGATAPAANATVRAVITDFGLARAMRTTVTRETIRESLDTGNHLVGTLPYMAPEQLEGRGAAPASDVYAFGLVIYEMVTGHQPFPGDPYNRLREKPPSPRVHVPTLDQRWASAITRCLDIDPAGRFQDPREVAVACSDRRRGIFAWSRARFAIALVAAVALLSVLLRFTDVRPAQIATDLLARLGVSTPLNQRDSILVADFENRTGERQFDQAVSALVIQAMQQSEYVNVVPRLRALEGARRAGRPSPTTIDADLGRNICIRDGYRALLTGQVIQRGSVYLIAVQLVNPHEEMAVVSLESEPMRSVADLYPTVDKLAANLRHRLGESLSQIQRSRPLADVTTPNLEALARYQRALDLYAAMDFQGSVAMAEGAIDLDPHFAMAHLLLASNYDRRSDEKDVQKELAIAKGEIDHVTNREKHLILALSDFADYLFEDAAREYRLLAELDPADIEAARGLSDSMFWSGDTDGGLKRQQQIIRMAGAGEADYSSLMTKLVYINHFQGALDVYKDARARGLENFQMHAGAALAQWGLGDFSTARRELETLSNSGDSFYQDLSKLTSAGLLIYQGDVAQAIRQLHGEPIREAQTAGLVIAYFDLLIRAELALKPHPPAQTYLLQLDRFSRRTTHPVLLLDVGLLAIELGDVGLARRVHARMRASDQGKDGKFLECAINALAGALHLSEGQIDASILAEEQACENYPLLAEPCFILGEARYAKEDWQGATDAYRQYLARKGVILRDEFPGNWIMCHLYLARAYAKLGDIHNSGAHYDEFLELWGRADPDLPTIRQAKAEKARLNLP
ncbi:MAG TPA: protein kinase [Terriglobia bacterium]|nr:protein kinase [Terriglobia bacterium]